MIIFNFIEMKIAIVGASGAQWAKNSEDFGAARPADRRIAAVRFAAQRGPCL